MNRDELLRAAIEVARSAAERGNHPFGAVLVDPAGAVLLAARNTVVTDRDPTGHAETNLVRLAGSTFSRPELGELTLYSSCEPCAMCAGAIYWSGIGRLVYALSEARLAELTGSSEENPTLAHPCRLVFADGQRQVAVEGPFLEDEAAEPHRGFWQPA